jgi:hypothetical protein
VNPRHIGARGYRESATDRRVGSDRRSYNKRRLERHTPAVERRGEGVYGLIGRRNGQRRRGPRRDRDALVRGIE